jgi:tyrosine-protein phosphatase SIW14
MQTRSVSILFSSFVVIIPMLAAEPQPAGVHNFHQVNEHVYRGAQPSKEGFQSLANLGVKTIIDLRGGGGRSAEEQKVVEAAGMHYVAVPLSGSSAPPDQVVGKLLTLLNDPSECPVFVHCRRGADRTGTIIACYRISHDHWDNARALAEAASDGMSRLEVAMKRYVKNFTLASPALAAVPAAVVSQ